jgi:hypothetical protein
MKIRLGILFVVFSLSVSAQRIQGEGIVLGRLVDQNAKKALEYVKIKVLLAKDSSFVSGQFTDSEGKFNIENLPFAPLSLQATFAGYDTLWINQIMPTKELRVVNLGEYNMTVNNQRIVDEIIVQGNTYIATCLGVLNNNVKLVLCDVVKETHMIDIELLKKKITTKTKAVIVVHLFGLMPNMDNILDICTKNNLYLIEEVGINKYRASFKDNSLSYGFPIQWMDKWFNKVEK